MLKSVKFNYKNGAVGFNDFLNPEKINKNVDGNLFLGNNDLGMTRDSKGENPRFKTR